MTVPQIELFPDEESERAVSPVIGVILMVAITVILAAVIGTFVLGLSDSVSEQASAGVSAEANGSAGGLTDVTVTSMGDSTDSVKCVPDGPDNGSTTTSNVGGKITCFDGDSVVAVSNDDDVEDKTIKTNLGN